MTEKLGIIIPEFTWGVSSDQWKINWDYYINPWYDEIGYFWET